ncbi:DUF3311 domain-containing protein [Pendulispora rubella]|uniref:DUF3311 domain-containing protein n=1 Tax=Pendulispora rubella TaxID=2741070 RepID=A0ABZ2KV25_9BACT
MTARTRYVLAAPLLAAPIIGLLMPGLYNRAEPAIAGFPFFYWYQLLWVALTMCTMSGAYFLVVPAQKARKNSGDV